ncbi:MAG: P63C domain-containing protein [Xanthobacteraceae bacterium]
MTKTLETIAGAADRPLKIGEIEIPCYVLEDETRVLSQRGLQTGIGMSVSGGSAGAQRLPRFIDSLAEKGIETKELTARIRAPIKFIPPGGGAVAYGYEATILADLCEAILAARDVPGALQPQQKHIADRCDILMRGFARVGIIAMVDEVTGYQYLRARRSLEQILDKFLRKELGRWAKRFPDEFYQQMFRLRGWDYNNFSTARPPVVGKYTLDLVYARIAPGVLEELLEREPKDDKGRRKHHLHRWFTEDIGHPELAKHIFAVETLMRANTSWDKFYRSMQRALPKQNANLELNLTDKEGEPL